MVTAGRWRRQVLFLVDNTQEISPQSLHVLRTAFSPRYDHVRFVLCFVQGNEQPETSHEFEYRLRSLGLDTHTMELQPPDHSFAAELAAALHVSYSKSDLNELLRATEKRASRLVAALRGAWSEVPGLVQVEREILRYLLVARQPLDCDDIRSLVLQSPRIESSRGTVSRAIDSLEEKHLIIATRHWYGTDIEIAPGRDRQVRTTVSSLESDLVAADEIYRYFTTVEKVRSQRHSPSAYGALLYKLAKQVDPASLPSRAFQLVRISLGQADLEAARLYVKAAIDASPYPSPVDLYTLLAFHVSVQEYDEANGILAAMGEDRWRCERILRIIHAVTLNRLRQHRESNVEIARLLAEETTDEEFALLLSYRIAAQLHDGQLLAARTEFEEAYPRLRHAQNAGYALRNCSAVYFWGETRDLVRADAVLREALATFESSGDRFGYFTALNNLATLAGCSDDPGRNIPSKLLVFQEVFEGLAIYGTQHLEEVGANLGVALLLSGQPARAASHLRKMISIASYDFPRVQMESALAFAEAQLGDIASARARLRALTAGAASVRLNEAVFLANLNAATVEAVVAGRSATFDDHICAARASGFWGGDEAVERLLGMLDANRLSVETISDALHFELMLYWSQNPLSVLLQSGLPAETKSDGVIN